jgi:ubiquinone/menaquinone biosynthesis C-methylase UbiE
MSFDVYAKNWDTDKRIDRAKVIAKEIIDSIDINESCSIMEFGCGTGLISFNLVDKFKKITLIDSSKGMIDILTSKIDAYKTDNMVARHLDLTDAHSLDERFDVIYSSMVLHHIHDIPDILKRLYELLNDDGILCIVDLNEEDGSFHKEYPDFVGHNGFDQEALKQIFVDAGFYDVESTTFLHDVKNIDGKKIDYSLFLMKARNCRNT